MNSIKQHHPRLFLCALALAFSCDALKEEEGTLTASIKPLSEIAIFANRDAIIDITSAITSPAQLKVVCTDLPQLGYLEVLPTGQFKYVPYLNNIGNDAMTFTVYSASGGDPVLPPQTVNIKILGPPQSGSCAIIPMSDNVTVPFYWDDALGYFIDPAQNDRRCGGSYSLSIYKPDAAFMPHYGKAVVSNDDAGYIYYTRNDNGKMPDTIMYKISDAMDPSSVSYGLIFIDPAACRIELHNDMMCLGDSQPNSVNLVANDELCGKDYELRASFSIEQFPRHGNLIYTPHDPEDYYNDSAPWEVTYSDTSRLNWATDTVRYKFCEADQCQTARLVIIHDAVCILSVRNDDVNARGNSGEVMSIDILNNDEVCGDVKSISIKVPPQHGTAAPDMNAMNVRYTPNRKLNDSFSYTLCTSNTCQTGIVYLTY